MLTYEPLKKYMRKHKLTFAELEKMSGVPHGSIYRIQKDKAVSLYSIDKIIDALGFSTIDQVIRYYPNDDGTGNRKHIIVTQK